MTTLTKSVLGFSTVATVAIVAIADVFNTSHLFNPTWPEHARFHIGMQFTSLVMVSAISLWALSGPFTRSRALLAAMAPLTFWPGLFVAAMIPGTSPYASPALASLGVPINLVLAAIFIALTLGALAFSGRVFSFTRLQPARA